MWPWLSTCIQDCLVMDRWRMLHSKYCAAFQALQLHPCSAADNFWMESVLNWGSWIFFSVCVFCCCCCFFSSQNSSLWKKVIRNLPELQHGYAVQQFPKQYFGRICTCLFFFSWFSFFFSPKDVAVLDTQYITFCGIILFRKMCKQYKFDGNMQMSGNKTACAKVEEHRQQISIL